MDNERITLERIRKDKDLKREMLKGVIVSMIGKYIKLDEYNTPRIQKNFVDLVERGYVNIPDKNLFILYMRDVKNLKYKEVVDYIGHDITNVSAIRTCEIKMDTEIRIKLSMITNPSDNIFHVNRSTNISCLPFKNTRTWVALHKAGINTVGDILSKTDTQLLNCQGLGHKGLKELKDVLNSTDLKQPDEEKIAALEHSIEIIDIEINRLVAARANLRAEIKELLSDD